MDDNLHTTPVLRHADSDSSSDERVEMRPLGDEFDFTTPGLEGRSSPAGAPQTYRSVSHAFVPMSAPGAMGGLPFAAPGAPFVMGHDFLSTTSNKAPLFEPSSSSSPQFVPMTPSWSLDDATMPALFKPSIAVSAPAAADKFHQPRDVPALVDMGSYNVVNPSFQSVVGPRECLEGVCKALDDLQCHYLIQPNWTVDVRGLVCAEEVQFRILVRRVKVSGHLQIDFLVLNGDEGNFTRIVDNILSKCSTLVHTDAAHDLGFSNSPLSPSYMPVLSDDDIDSIPEVYPGSLRINADQLEMLCHEMSGVAESTSYSMELAKSIKNACLSRHNRELIVHEVALRRSFEAAIKSMINNDSDEIKRYAIFMLGLFDNAKTYFAEVNMDLVLKLISEIEGSESQIPKTKYAATALKTKLLRGF